MSKGYLNSAEREKYVMMAKLMDMVDVAGTWDSNNTITKEERKNFKTAGTLIYKALDSIMVRMPSDTQKSIAKALTNSTLLLSNEWGLQQYLKKKSADEKVAFEDNKEFFDLVEAVCYNNCKGCEKEPEGCLFYKQFERLYISDMGDSFGKCRFAYKMEGEEDGK